jgi:hypothetical protein
VPCLFLVACGGGTTSTSSPSDGGKDAFAAGDATGGGDDGGGPQHTTTHDCAPACGAAKFCQYPLGPGICPGPNDVDAGFCPQGCSGCPALPPPSCSALPAACNGTPTCDCLLTVCPGGCGSQVGSCTIDADGDWVIGCLTC